MEARPLRQEDPVWHPHVQKGPSHVREGGLEAPSRLQEAAMGEGGWWVRAPCRQQRQSCGAHLLCLSSLQAHTHTHCTGTPTQGPPGRSLRRCWCQAGWDPAAAWGPFASWQGAGVTGRATSCVDDSAQARKGTAWRRSLGPHRRRHIQSRGSPRAPWPRAARAGGRGGGCGLCTHGGHCHPPWCGGARAGSPGQPRLWPPRRQFATSLPLAAPAVCPAQRLAHSRARAPAPAAPLPWPLARPWRAQQSAGRLGARRPSLPGRPGGGSIPLSPY